MKRKRNIAYIVLGALGGVFLVFYGILYLLPSSWLGMEPIVPVGTSITDIQGSDRISDSRTTINDNFDALNAGKLELTDFYATTSHSQINRLARLSVVGTITTGTWNGTAIAQNKGGTGFSTYSTGDLLYASAANTLSKRTASTTG